MALGALERQLLTADQRLLIRNRPYAARVSISQSSIKNQKSTIFRSPLCARTSAPSSTCWKVIAENYMALGALERRLLIAD